MDALLPSGANSIAISCCLNASYKCPAQELGGTKYWTLLTIVLSLGRFPSRGVTIRVTKESLTSNYEMI